MTKFFLARSQKKPTGAVIKRVLVRCPSTGKLTATGQTTKDASWPKVRFKPPTGNCPHCRRDHSWKKEDVILAR